MSNPTSKRRNRAFIKQQRRCYYCTALMWLRKPDEFAKEHRLTRHIAFRFQCTAEHLVPRHAGGVDDAGNIVAACWFCNVTRHRRRSHLASERFRKFVRGRLRHLRWHPTNTRHLLEGF